MEHFQFFLSNTQATMDLGVALALALRDFPAPPAIYLFGGLGAGKTTLGRGLVGALPGGDKAEVGSPSFTLCNIYPTRPKVLHADLYRLPPGSSLPEEMGEDLSEDVLLILEWPENLNLDHFSQERLEINLTPLPDVSPEKLDNQGQPCEEKRLATVSAHGLTAQKLLEQLKAQW